MILHTKILSLLKYGLLLSETDSLADTAIFKLAGQVSPETCLSKCFGTVEWRSPSDGRSSGPDENPWAQARGLGKPGHHVTLISHLIPGLPLHLPGLQQEPKGPIRTGWQDYSLGTLGVLSCAATQFSFRILPSSPPRPKVQTKQKRSFLFVLVQGGSELFGKEAGTWKEHFRA